MSGTSMDGIDAVLVDCSGLQPQLLATHGQKYPPGLRRQLAEACRLKDPRSVDLSALDLEVGREFARSANTLLDSTRFTSADITAIGSHGQTIRHQPEGPSRFTLQIGNPRLISKLTEIDVVADFRPADMQAGGQGAPLVPAFHHAVFSHAGEARVVVNIGGIANITVLPDADPGHVTGFDTGPGNTLMDAWAQRFLGLPLDVDGRFAVSGIPDDTLLQPLLADPYFHKAPPKSTGPEYFNLDWLQRSAAIDKLRPQDVQATLCELTARSIADAIYLHAPGTVRLLVCGGGAFNIHLMQRLAVHLHGIAVSSTADYGIDPDWVEAAAFAWLARQRLSGRPGNLPAVTGADRAVLLGNIFRHSGNTDPDSLSAQLR